MSIGDLPEILSQQILIGIILVGRLGVSVVAIYHGGGVWRWERRG